MFKPKGEFALPRPVKYDILYVIRVNKGKRGESTSYDILRGVCTRWHPEYMWRIYKTTVDRQHAIATLRLMNGNKFGPKTSNVKTRLSTDD